MLTAPRVCLQIDMEQYFITRGEFSPTFHLQYYIGYKQTGADYVPIDKLLTVRRPGGWPPADALGVVGQYAATAYSCKRPLLKGQLSAVLHALCRLHTATGSRACLQTTQSCAFWPSGMTLLLVGGRCTRTARTTATPAT
jgi:hypothetical protein